MDFEELQDMAVISIEKQKNTDAVESLIENFGKLIYELKEENKPDRKKIESAISQLIILMIFVSYKLNIHLEDSILNKIEGSYKK
jgi:hypothetical protein